MNAMWFRKNGVEGTRRVAPAGHHVYTVTHAPSGRHMTTDVSSLALRIAREWAEQAPVVELFEAHEHTAANLAAGLPADFMCGCAKGDLLVPCRHTAPRVESPLPIAERCSSGLARGASLTMPTDAQARALDNSRGVVLRYGSTGVGLTVLRSLARRGWIVLDDRIRPAHGVITSNGRRARARYEASKAGAR